eukprot:1158198-Pelagomonas_calceolata.AAC.4
MWVRCACLPISTSHGSWPGVDSSSRAAAGMLPAKGLPSTLIHKCAGCTVVKSLCLSAVDPLRAGLLSVKNCCARARCKCGAVGPSGAAKAGPASIIEFKKALCSHDKQKTVF